MDIKSGFYQLYCYSNVVCYQIVGSAYTPLLSMVKVQGVYSDIVTQNFNQPDSLSIAKKDTENIHIEIKTDQNIPVNFTYGKTIMKLHLRPTKALVSL